MHRFFSFAYFTLLFLLVFTACTAKIQKQSIYIDPSLRGEVKKSIEETYNAQGQLTNRTVQEYSRDQEPLLIDVINYTDGEETSRLKRTNTYEYDENLRLISAHGTDESSFSNDVANTVTKVTYPAENTVLVSTLINEGGEVNSRSNKYDYRDGYIHKSISRYQLDRFSHSKIELNFTYDERGDMNSMLSTFSMLYEDMDYADEDIEPVNTRMEYAYTEYDEKGNWTAGTETEVNQDGTTEVSSIKRSLEYY